MGVYIKSMEMPTNCRTCHLKINCKDCEGLKCLCVPLHQQIGYLDDLLMDKRRDDCPLVPVPEHGDLIDRDEMKGSIRKQAAILRLMGEEFAEIAETLEKGFLQEIDNAPTIIPAELAKEEA